eukprot:UN18852
MKTFIPCPVKAGFGNRFFKYKFLKRMKFSNASFPHVFKADISAEYKHSWRQPKIVNVFF